MDINKKDTNINILLFYVSLLIFIFSIGMFLFNIFNEEKNENISDFLVCEEQYNDTKDKHTLKCCESCNYNNDTYGYDIQYQKASQIIDICVCNDIDKQEQYYAWNIQ